MRSALYPQNAFSAIRLATFCLFLGRGWQFLFHPEQLSFLTENTILVQVVGALFLFCSWQVFITKSLKEGRRMYLLVFTLPLFLMTLASWQAKSFMIAQFIELTAQWATPLLFFLLLRGIENKKLTFLLLITTALVFTGHGLYAANIFPRPDHFYEMTGNILGLNKETAGMFLLTAGILDLIVSGGIFIKSISKYLLLYAVIWGLLTSMARPIAYVEWNSFFTSLSEWLPAMVYRLPHALIPLAAYYFLTEKERSSINRENQEKEVVV